MSIPITKYARPAEIKAKLPKDIQRMKRIVAQAENHANLVARYQNQKLAIRGELLKCKAYKFLASHLAHLCGISQEEQDSCWLVAVDKAVEDFMSRGENLDNVTIPQLRQWRNAPANSSIEAAK